MKLKSANELTNFLSDFSQVIELLDTEKNLRSFTNQNKKLFVDLATPGELRFLVQFYNEMASLNAGNEIDLDELWEKKLHEAGLSGVNADQIDTNLLIFFSNYQLVKPTAHNQVQPQQLQSDLDELKMVQNKLDKNHYYKNPLANLITLAECNDGPADKKPFNGKPTLATYNNIDKMVTTTRKFVAPKFGEKNCLSYDRRLADYKTQARLNSFASFGNGLLAPLSLIASVATFIAAAALFTLIIKVSMGTALLGLALPGAMLASVAVAFPATGLFLLTMGLVEKANYQRKMSGAMFSVAAAQADPALDENLPILAMTSP